MKRVFYTLLFSLFTMVLTAQQEKVITVNNLQELVNTLDKDIKAWEESKSYDKLAPAYDKILEAQASMSNEDKANTFEFYLRMKYNKVRCLAALKKYPETISGFKELLDEGYTNYNRFIEDEEFDSFRGEEEFAQLALILQNKGDYAYILRKGGPYFRRPEFVYESPDSPELIRIREYFNLDSIAGTGDEVSRVMNVMEWTHNTLEHNGGYWADFDMTAITIYEHARDNKTGVNCRSQAVFLNECYLALGIKSRFITCCPRDNYNQEAHVINTVFLESLNKWIWVDATFQTVVMDENGVLLSIPEVRNRLMNEEPLFISENANWNNRASYTKKSYLDNYMGKLLYWFGAPIVNKHGADNNYSRNSTAILLPIDFKKETRSFEYVTYDDEWFWD